MRALATPEAREEESLLLLEGTHLLEEVLRTDVIPKEIVVTDSWLKKHLSILNSMPKQVIIREVTPEVLKVSLTTNNPDGVATLFPLTALPRGNKTPKFVLALDRLQDPGNLGTLFRTALAADVDVLWLALGAEPLSQKVIRSSAGAILHLPYERLAGSEEEAVGGLAEKLQMAVNCGYQVVATTVPGDRDLSVILPYWELDWSLPTVLVLGNEGSGLHNRIKSCCTHCITLPHSEKVESLNVASVAVPLLMERRRAKMTSLIR